MRTLRGLGVVVVSAALVAGCTSDDGVDSGAATVRPAAALVAPATILGTVWHEVPANSGATVAVVRACASAQQLLVDRGAAAPESATSYVWAGERQAATTEDAAAQTSVARFTDADAAAFAMRSLTPARLQRCVATALTAYVRGQDATDRDPRSDVPPEQVPSEHVTGDGKTAVLLRAHFDESVLGGSDNANEVGLSARRDGATVVLAVTATSGQTIGPRSATRPADDLAGAMLRAIRRR